MKPVFIRQMGLLSSAGSDVQENWQQLHAAKSFVTQLGSTHLAEAFTPEMRLSPVAILSKANRQKLFTIGEERSLRLYDQAVWGAVLVARQATRDIAGKLSDTNVVCGSSRGATHSWEEALNSFYDRKKLRPSVSPATTPGSLASVVATDRQCLGGHMFVSATCTTGLQVIGAAIAMMELNRTANALAVSSEFSTTPFTLEQLRALGVYAPGPSYQPFTEGTDGMVLGEGAAALLLSSQKTSDSEPSIIGFGTAGEVGSPTGLSADGESLKLAIEKSLSSAGIAASQIDLVVGHGSGTKMGDASEWAAYARIFAEAQPQFTAFKWSWGHALGASALMSTVMAAEMLRRQDSFGLPYADVGGARRNSLQHVLVTALGFGGQAAAIVLKK